MKMFVGLGRDTANRLPLSRGQERQEKHYPSLCKFNRAEMRSRQKALFGYDIRKQGLEFASRGRERSTQRL